ncbi:E3 ubiquitin-protein ligase TRIM63-like [Acanthochromis polyacanthus]|uniref:E3 ubiquitin-protein ligase TRIM63-like n=1 Tax=Acanthochromis polyacanthus TaxID=80966 RepID=UPI002233E6B5|nr:E3 ubiquitin-protein ligase TRIM63-like [Acanthochromis polyacanthus]
MDIQTGPLVPLGAMESLEKQLSCPICLDMFTKPVVILPCQHNLCRGCANDLYESRNPYHFSGGTFRCPTCRFEVVLDRHGVYGLQRNLLVENIIDIYKQQQERKEEDVPLKDGDSKQPRCKEHEEEHINIYCLSCQTPTCSMCKVFGQHRDCSVSPLPAVYQSQKNELRAAVELLAVASGSVQAEVEQLEETRRRLEENAELQRRRLGESFDLLFALLEEKKMQLLERVDGEQRDRTAALQALRERYRQQLQQSQQLQEKLQQNLQSCGVAQFLVAAKPLQEEARRAAQENQLQRPEAGLESLEHLQVDSQQLEALLAHMDFRKDE